MAKLRDIPYFHSARMGLSLSVNAGKTEPI
jgi:hypothetical protein